MHHRSSSHLSKYYMKMLWPVQGPIVLVCGLNMRKCSDECCSLWFVKFLVWSGHARGMTYVSSSATLVSVPVPGVGGGEKVGTSYSGLYARGYCLIYAVWVFAAGWGLSFDLPGLWWGSNFVLLAWDGSLNGEKLRHNVKFISLCLSKSGRFETMRK